MKIARISLLIIATSLPFFFAFGQDNQPNKPGVKATEDKINTNNEIKSLIHDLKNNSTRTGAIREIKRLPRESVIPLMMDLLANDSSFLEPGPRNAAHEILIKLDVLNSEMGKLFMIRSLSDPLLRAKSLFYLSASIDSLQRASFVEATQPALTDTDLPVSYRGAVFRHLIKAGFHGPDLILAAELLFLDTRFDSSDREGAARVLLKSHGLNKAAKIFLGSDPIGMKVGLWALASFIGNDLESYKASDESRRLVEKLVIEALVRGDSEVKMRVLTTIGIVYGDRLFIEDGDEVQVNPALLAALKTAELDEVDPEVKSLLENGINGLLSGAKKKSNK